MTKSKQNRISERAMVNAVIAFANGSGLPEFLWRLPGTPRLLVPLKLPHGAVIDRVTGKPAKVEQHLRQGAVPFDTKAASALEEIRTRLHRDMLEIAEKRLDPGRRKEIAAEANRVTVEIKGGQRRMRPAFLRTPDLAAALGYATYLIATRTYGQRLARCKLDRCENFFLREARRGQPERYCGRRHYLEANEQRSAGRSKDYRARQNAIRQLSKRYPSSARALVRTVKEPGLSSDELVRRATEHAALKHK